MAQSVKLKHHSVLYASRLKPQLVYKKDNVTKDNVTQQLTLIFNQYENVKRKCDETFNFEISAIRVYTRSN